eukprot:4319053-Prymnesium_polylepis.2
MASAGRAWSAQSSSRSTSRPADRRGTRSLVTTVRPCGRASWYAVRDRSVARRSSLPTVAHSGECGQTGPRRSDLSVEATMPARAPKSVCQCVSSS